MLSKRKNTVSGENESSPEREGASSRHLDKEYNSSYRKWRHDNKGKYGFFYSDKKNEYVYENGRGFIKDIPEFSEISALGNVNTIISRILTIYMLFMVLVNYAFPGFLANVFGVSIGINLNTGELFGDEVSIIIYQYITEIFGRLIPLFMLAYVTKMPFKIMFPTKISNMPLFKNAVPAALLVASAGSVMMYPYKAILSLFNANTDVNYPVTNNLAVQILYVVLKTLLIPIISELIVHGSFFQLLRQFGDGYAVVVTSLIMALNSSDIRTFPFYFIIGAVGGYFALRTGSVITSIIMRMTISVYFYVQSFFWAIDDEHISRLCSLNFMMFCCLVGLVFMIIFMIKYSNKLSLPLKDTYLSPYEKSMEFLTNPSVIIWLSMGFAEMVITIPLNL